MKKLKIIAQVMKEEIGYSAVSTVKNHFICSQADTYDELKVNFLEAVNLTFQDSFEYAPEEIIYEMDIASFFDSFPYLNVSALADRIGINKSLLAQYANGSKKPAPKQAQRILTGIQQLGNELAAVRFS
ncbi:MAG: helix-turn-helix transcriptional regulator [Ignavibacteriae bacterium]|nr:helix-turn-helix transcriptional regulator [Ignavibacteriota bacterium]